MSRQTRRKWICLVGTAGIGGVAGCSSSEEPPASEEPTLTDETETGTETEAETEAEPELPSDVTKQWAFQTGREVSSSPAVVDWTVYLGSDDGNMYALSNVYGESEE